MMEKAAILKFKLSYNLKISNDGKYIANIDNSKVNLFDVSTGKVTCSFKDLKYPSRISFSHNSKFLAAKNTAGKISVYDNEANLKIKSITPSRREGCELHFTPDDAYLISADWDGNIHMIDIKDEKVEVIKRYQSCMVESLKFDKKSNIFYFLVSQRRSDKFTETAIDDYNILLEWKYPFDSNEPVEHRIDCTTWAVQYNSSMNCYAALNYESLVLYDHEFNVLESIMLGERVARKGLDWSSKGDYILVTWGKTVRIYECPSLKKIKSFELDSPLCFEFAHQEDDKRIFLGTYSSSYYLDFDELIHVDIESDGKV